MSSITKIGLLAGSGQMPLEIIKHCATHSIEVFVVCLQPFANETDYQLLTHTEAKLGEAGKIIKFLKAHDVYHVVLAGGIKRPSFKELIPDWEGAKIAAKLAMKKMGDDSLFRAVIDEFESRNFRITSIEEVVPDMMFTEGVYGKIKPTEDDLSDIQRGIVVARALGAVDVGQAVVVQEGMVLAVEAIEGTDRMLERAASLRKDGKGPVMIKVLKPGQDLRVDLPAIGKLTIEQLTKHGMRGIAVESGGILLIEREQVIKMADEAGIFIIGIKID